MSPLTDTVFKSDGLISRLSVAHCQVTSSGWAEGECKGKAGWFPYEYIERRERVLASKVSEVF